MGESLIYGIMMLPFIALLWGVIGWIIYAICNVLDSDDK